LGMRKQVRKNGRSKRREKQLLIMWCGRRKIFSLGCRTGKTIYWGHNLNVMHIENNVMDSILGTILDIKGKTKDDLVACQDLQEMGLRNKQHPYSADDGRTYLPVACHTISKDDKTHFLKVL